MSDNYSQFGPISEATGDDWAAIDGFVWLKYTTTNGTIVFEEIGEANGAKIKIVASPLKEGDDFPIEVLAETALAAGGTEVKSFSDYYPRIKVLAKSAAAGQSATVQASGSAI